MKRIISLFIVAVTSLMLLSAANVSFSVSPLFSDISDMEYKVNETEYWISVPSDGNIVVDASSKSLELKKGEELIYIDLIEAKGKDFDARWKWCLEPDRDIKTRYSINGATPEEVAHSSREVVTPNLDINNLYLFKLEGQKNDGQWAEIGSCGLVPYKKILTPEEKASRRFDRDFIISGSYIATFQKLSIMSQFENGQGFRVSVVAPFKRNFGFSVSTNYQWLEYKNEPFMECSLIANLRFSTDYRKVANFYIQAGGGENFVFRDERFAYYPMANIGVGLDIYMMDTVGLSVLFDYSASFQRDSFNSHFTISTGLSFAIGKEV